MTRVCVQLLAVQGSSFVQQQHIAQGAEFKRIQQLGKGNVKKHPMRPRTEPLTSQREVKLSLATPRCSTQVCIKTPRGSSSKSVRVSLTSLEHADPPASHHAPPTPREALVARVGTMASGRLHSSESSASKQSGHSTRLSTRGSTSLSRLQQLRGYACVCVREREREGGRERESVCVCVRERVCVCARACCNFLPAKK